MKKPLLYHAYSRIAVMVLLLMMFSSAGMMAQTRGATAQVTDELMFQKSFEKLQLDPTPLTGNGSRVSFMQTFGNDASRSPGLSMATAALGAAGISIPKWLTQLTNGVEFFCSGVNPTLKLTASVDVGGYYELHSVGTADVAVKYPVQVTVTYPDANTFGCGDPVTIRTAYTVTDPAKNDKLTVDPPFFNQEIGPQLKNLKLEAGLGLEAWVGFGVKVWYPCGWSLLDWCSYETCSDDKWEFNESANLTLTPPIPNLPPLLNLCEGAFGPGANEASLLACGWSGTTPLLKLGQWLIDDYNERHNGNYSFASFPNHYTVEIATPDLPSSNPLTLPEMEGTFLNVSDSKLTSQSLAGGTKLKVSGYAESVSRMSIDMVSFLDYSGVTTSLSMGGGKGSVDAGDVAPTFAANQRMNFEFEPVIHMQVDLGRQMTFSVFDADGTFSHSGTGQVVSLLAGQYIEALFPQELSEPVAVAMSSRMDGTLSTKVEQDYYKSIQVKMGKVHISGLTSFNIIDEELAKTKFATKTILDHDLTLEVGTLSLPGFVLDPENPVIAIDYLNMEDMVNLGGGQQGVVYKMGISNQGDVRLDELQLQFDLAEAFAGALSMEVECTNSDDLSLNVNYNGSSDIGLLGAGNTLAPGETAMVEVLVRVKPQVAAIGPTGCFEPVEYLASATAIGVSPIGTRVESNFNQCTQQRTAPDLIAAVDLGAAVIESIEDFTVYGWEQVRIDKSLLRCMGNVGTGGDLIFVNTSFQDAAPTVVVGDLFVGGSLLLEGRSQVEAGYVMTGGPSLIANWQSRLTLNGALSENAQCVPLQPQQTLTYPAGEKGKRVQLMPGEIRELTPGTYDWVRLSGGSHLILGPGVYHIGRWQFMGDNVMVKYRVADGPVELNLGAWMVPGRSNLQLVAEGGTADAVTYRVAGSQKSSFRNSHVQGRIVAPHAEMEFSEGTLLEGMVYARNVVFRTGASFTDPEYLKPLNISEACQNVLLAEATAETREEPLQAANMVQDPSQLNIYPNPTQGRFTIAGLPGEGPLQVKVYNALGVLVQQMTALPNENLMINLEKEPMGMYTVEVEGYKPQVVVKY